MTRRPARLDLALFGDPVEHSLSPRIHQAFGAALGIEVHYRLIRVAAVDLAAALADFYVAAGHGANLTLPHKQAAVGACRRLLASGRAAGVVNTLVRGPAGWSGANTDGLGLCRDLRRLLPGGLRGRRVLVLGAGGAAAGIVPALLAAGAGPLAIVNRTAPRAAELAARFAGRVWAIAAGEVYPETGGKPFVPSLLINATSAGHDGTLPALLASPAVSSALPGCELAYDLSYGAAARPFVHWAGERGIAASDGLGMLVEQAAAAFRLWSGRRPDPRPVLAGLSLTSAIHL